MSTNPQAQTKSKLWGVGLALVLLSSAVLLVNFISYAVSDHGPESFALLGVMVISMFTIPFLIAGALAMFVSASRAKRLSAQAQTGAHTLDTTPSTWTDTTGAAISLALSWLSPLSIPLTFWVWRRTPLNSVANKIAAVALAISVLLPLAWICLVLFYWN